MALHNVLIVDDLPRNIQVLGKILTDEGFRVAFATNGTDALKLVGETQFDCILLDIMMPVMDGFDVCKELKSRFSSRDIPVIFLTAKNDQESIVKGFALGAQDFVTKPFNSAELIARVKTHIDLVEKRKELSSLNLHLEDKVRQRTAELEIANKQLARLDQAKNDFLNIISHELRTPLTGITGLTGLLDQTLLDVEQKEYIQYLKEAAGKLARFGNIALLITSLQSRHSHFEMFPTSVNVILDMAADASDKLIQGKNISLRLGTYPSDTMILCEPDLLRECFIIAIETFADYLPAGADLTIGYEHDETAKYFYICDCNHSFSNELLNKYSDDLSDNLMEAYEEIGLSLTAVSLMMRLQNGRMTISNLTTGGAQIRFQLD